jgi:trehalose-6-phosphatase
MKVIAETADCEWHDPQAIATKIGVPKKQVEDTFEKMLPPTKPTMFTERKEVGPGWHYRMFSNANMVSMQELTTKLVPIAKALKVEGKKNMVTLSPGTVEGLATKLQRLIEEWIKRAKPCNDAARTASQLKGK